MLARVRERYRFALIALGLFAAAFALSCSGDDTSSPPPTIIADPFHAAPAVVRVELLLTSNGKATTHHSMPFRVRSRRGVLGLESEFTRRITSRAARAA